MATFTITDAKNIDELTTKAGADTYNVNGGTLTIDQNTLFGHNTGTAGGLGNITISASLGGTVEIDGRYVRAIPYDGGSGNVPAYNTTISGGGASGKMIGVVATMQTAPTAPAAAMPATGFILVKQWNEVPYADNTALTGITATVNGTDVVAPIFIVGNEASSRAITCVRLGKFRARGAWVDLGVTSGTSTTAYSYPTYGQSNLMLPGVWVESQYVDDVYDFYPCDRRAAAANQLGTEAARGKYCYNTVTTAAAAFRLGHDGTNVNGYTPPAGRKIRIPSVWLVDATAAAVVSPTATIATRPEFVTTGGGDVEMNTVISHWYLNFAQAYAVSLISVATEAIVISECATQALLSDVGTGPLITTVQTPLTMSLNFAGASIADSVFSKYSLGATSVAVLTDCGFVDINNVRFECPAARSGAAVPVSMTRVKSSVLTECVVVGGPVSMITCDGITITDLAYIDRSIYSVTSNNAVYAFAISSNSQNITISGLAFPVPNNGPYSGLVSIAAAGCANIKIRNIGLSDEPLDCGVGPLAQYSWTRSTTTATVTWTGHGMVVGDAFYVVSSSSTGAITNTTTYLVVGVTDANTFTFTCTSGGSASGTFTAYRTSCAGLGVFATGGAGYNIKVQRVYLKNTRRIFTGPDNSFKKIVFENVDLEPITVIATTALEQTTKNMVGRHTITAGSSVYGTHWVFNDVSYAAVAEGLAWTRSGTTVTLTFPDAGLFPGDEITIFECSSTAAIPIGKYAITTTGTLDTFTLTGVNAGATSGTLSAEPLLAKAVIMMNEATDASAENYSIEAGAPKFTSAGTLVMPSIGDQITWETRYWMKNYGASQWFEPVLAGTSITLSNHELYYALDTGSGYGDFKQLMYPRAGGGGSNGSTNITMTSTAGVVVGSYVTGTNVALIAQVVSITNGTTIVVTVPNVGTVSGILRFSEFPDEVWFTQDFKIKVRLKTVAAAASTSFSSITMYLYRAAADEYQLDSNTITFTGLPTGCDAVVLAAGTATILDQSDSLAGTSYTYTYSGAQDVDVGFLKPGYVPFYIRNLSLTASDSSIPVTLSPDRNYQ